MSGLDFLQSLEQWRSPLLNDLFVSLTMLGSEKAYLVLLVTVYLCVGHRFGFHLFVMFLLSAFVNSVIKDARGTERPFMMYPSELHPLATGTAGGHAFPSGHAQDSTVVWTLIAVRQGRWWWWLLAAVLALSVGFSRLYLQVHWPADVLGGWLIGLVLVMLYLLFVGIGQSREWKLTAVQSAAVIAALSVFMVVAGAGENVYLRTGGTLLGAGLGYILLDARGYDARAPWPIQGLKVVIAVAVLLGLQRGIEVVLGDTGTAVYVCYAVMGFTGTYLLPAFFSAFHEWRSGRESQPQE